MSTTLVLLVLGGLLAAGVYGVSQWKRSRIMHTGRLVTAKVTQVQMWQDAPRAGVFLQSRMIPLLGVKWWYEIRAEWSDPHTGNTYVFTSGVKKGLPKYQQGDYLAAYMSPYGNYLKLS